MSSQVSQNDRPGPPAKPGSIRKAQAAHRRQLLLEAALQLFSERGYRNASVRELTRTTGVTEAVMYHYFDNKAGILKAVLSEYAPFAKASTIIETQGDAPLELVLSTTGSALLDLLHERRQLVLTMLSESTSDPDLAELLSGFLRSVVGDIARFLESRRPTGEIGPDIDPMAAAQAFVGALLTQFLTSALIEPAPADGSDRQAFAAALARTLTAGLSAPS